jgi:Xaa-Pro aminopeptidase
VESTNFKLRRQKLSETLNNKGLVIITANSHCTRSHDTEYPFRQNSDFKYLVGTNEPEAILVLCPQNKDFHECLFVRPNHKEQEMWSGRRLGVEGTQDLLQMPVFSLREWQPKVQELLKNHEGIHLDLFGDKKLLETMIKLSKNLKQQSRRADFNFPRGIFDLGDSLGRQKLVKDQNEVLNIKEALKVTTQAHKCAMALCGPGKNEKELTSIIEYLFNRDAEGVAYENIVAGGDNANVLHYVDNNKPFQDGDLVLIDAGCQYNLYASDITRTFPVNGKFSSIQKEVYEIVLQAQRTAIGHSLIGKTWSEIHKESIHSLSRGLKELKVFDQSLDEIIEQKLFRKYFPHGTGHWLGLDVHDNVPYQDIHNKEIPFESGMVFTIEPGLYFPKNDPDLPTHLQGIGIRIEDNILISPSGPINLSSAIPKEIRDIEAACAANYQDFI